jgi:hypothetical protein
MPPAYARGYRVQSHTGRMVQLVKPKRFGLIWALLWLLVGGVGLLVYLLYFLAKRDSRVCLIVGENGRVR